MRLFGRPFRPRLWPTLMAAPAFLVLIGLGVWQLDRLQQKEALIATLEQRFGEAPAPLPQSFGDPGEWVYKRVVLQGHFLHDQEFLFPGKPYKGTVGNWIATPFVLDDGRSVIVFRGWVPDQYIPRATRELGLPQGETTVEGILHRGGWDGWEWLRPVNDPGHNLWLYFDPPAMAAAANLQNAVTDVYVEALGDEKTGLLPIGRNITIDVPNDHLQYAITWFSLAIALLVIYFVFHLRPPSPSGRPR